MELNVFLTELARLKDVPLMMEHLNSAEEYAQAAQHICSVGKVVNIEM